MRATTWHRIYSAIFAAGLALILITSVDVDEMGIFRLGVMLAIIGGVRLVIDKVTTDRAEMERGRQSGYDDGYDDGCSVRPSSRFSAVSPTVARLARRRPTQQLGEHGDVRDGQQGVS